MPITTQTSHRLPAARRRKAFPGILGALALLLSNPGLTDTQTRTVAFQYDASGLLIKEIVEPGNSDLCLVTAYIYDGYGNKAGSTTRNCNGSVGSHSGINSEAAAPAATSPAVFSVRSISTGFDARGQFPVTATNALSQSETRVFDARFGQVSSLTGPNGLTTTWQFDGFGRKIKETLPDGALSTWSYNLCAACGGLSNAAYTITATQAGAPTTITYYDGLDRIIRTQATGFDGSSSIYQDTIYDSLGRMAQKSKPYYTGQPVYWIRYTYDVLGRVVAETAPDNSVTAFSYQGLTTRITNAANQTQVKTKNAWGLLASITDPAGKTLTYGYDAQGNLLRTTDPNGNVIRLTYDLRGRKTAMADPDLGSWQYRYNALGELVGQTDAKGQVSNLSYDPLGRLAQRSEPDLVSTWYYDTDAAGNACGKGIGKLCEAKADNAYRRLHHYDVLGRPDSVATTLDQIYTSSVSYDGLGRPATRTWPTGFAVKYVYTSLGYLKEVRNAQTDVLYWQANTFDAEGHLLTETQGNGVVTQHAYNPASGRLAATLAGAGNSVQNLAYAFDTLGNLTSRQDNAAGSLESFSYDNLNRLTIYSLQGPGVSGIVTRTVAYDALGNITAKSDVGNYYYAPGTPPHAVTQVSGGPGKNYSQSYDANGNLIYTAINDLASGQTATRFEDYTSFNMPKQLRQGPAGQAQNLTLGFAYGPEHQRTKQISSVNGTTYYLNGTDGQALDFEKDIKPDGTVESKHYLIADGTVVAQYTSRSNGTQSLRYFHRDHLGSASVISDEAGTVLERLAYDPWGRRQYANGGTPPAGYSPATTDRGYTMQEHLDEMGIVHMNGRVYDPTLGRFMSADPLIQAPSNLQSFNRFSYAFNMPLVLTDPSGFCSQDDYGNDCWRDTSSSYVDGETGSYGYLITTSRIDDSSSNISNQGWLFSSLGGQSSFPWSPSANASGGNWQPRSMGGGDVSPYYDPRSPSLGDRLMDQFLFPTLAKNAVSSWKEGHYPSAILSGFGAGGDFLLTALSLGEYRVGSRAGGKLIELLTEAKNTEALSANVAGSITKRGIVEFQGFEVRAVRDLSHLDEGTLRAMQDIGFAAKDAKGNSLVLHHHQQNPAGPIFEMPGKNHNIGNARQHPFGNTKGAGLSGGDRALFNQWRTDYWKERASAELKRRGLQ